MVTIVPAKLISLKDSALDIFFPRRCLGCGRLEDFICSSCWPKIPRLTGPVCLKCGRPQMAAIVCGPCELHAGNIDGIRSVGPFEGVLKHAIYDLKFNNVKSIASNLAFLLADYLQKDALPADVLVPVPLHSERLKERGYNQSALLAGKLGVLCSIAVAEGCLKRWKSNPPQSKTKGVATRRENVAGSFICANRTLVGERVLLVDDVCTSGATLEACAQALKAGGALSVWGLTVAREI